MYAYVWILVYFAVFLKHTESLSMVYSHNERKFNFPGDQQSTSADNLPGLEGRQAVSVTPTQPAPVATTAIPANAAQTCICVPTGACNSTISPVDGSGVIDIRIVTNVSPSPLPTGVPPTAPPLRTCATGLVSCCQPGPYQCGVRYPPVVGAPVAAVAAGQAPYGSYPWQVVLLQPNYWGSGVLVNNLNVLTVAHRVSQFVNAPATLKIKMGEWNLGVDTGPIPAQEFSVSRIFLHPNFNAANLKNDIAILRLATPVPLGNTPTIATGCLPATSFVGARCFVSGWGRNDFANGTMQTIQKQVDVPILPTAQCQSALAATKLGSGFVFDAGSFICAGGEAGKDACTGDGGSPLMCAIGNHWFVAGLVAWGIGCGTNNVPGVYVNVATYVPWIQTTLIS